MSVRQNPAGQFWKTLSAGDKRAILITVAVVAIALFVQALWFATTETERLRGQLPVLQSTLARMQFQANELTKLKQLRVSSNLSGRSLESVIKGELKGIAGHLTMQILESHRVELNGETDFTTLLQLLGKLQSSYGIRVVRAEVARVLGESSLLITASVELAAPDSN